MLKTRFEEIVDVQKIGSLDVSLGDLNETLITASRETLSPAANNSENILVLGIDFQNDFMQNGSLGVPNSHGDVERFCKFIYNNIDKISRVAMSLDTHIPHQIFNPYWWVDQNGEHPDPFTVITLAELDAGRYRAVKNPIGSRKYVEELEKQGKKVLLVWTYHCLLGSLGCALEYQLSKMINFYSVAKKSVIQYLVKGTDPLSEMYGIIKPEYDEKGFINIAFLNAIATYDKIVIAGEASSHCVLESVKQILEHYDGNFNVLQKIYILEDCMSPVSSFEQYSIDEWAKLKNQYKINIVKSTELSL